MGGNLLSNFNSLARQLPMVFDVALGFCRLVSGVGRLVGNGRLRQLSQKKRGKNYPHSIL